MRPDPPSIVPIALLGASLVFWGCGSPEGGPTGEEQEELFLETIGTAPLDSQGVSSPWSWTTPGGAGSFVIRVRAPEEQHQDRLCYTLVDVAVAGEIWVGSGETAEDWGSTCQDCIQRVQLGHGYGFFSLPNNGDVLGAEPVEVSGRVALRDCETRLPVDAAIDGALPEEVNVEASSAPTPREDAVGEVSIALAVASPVAPTGEDLAAGGLWAQALEVATEVLSQAGLSVTLGQVLHVTPPTDRPLEFGPGDRDAIDTLFQGAKEEIGPHQVPVFALPCLERYDSVYGQRDALLAHVPRIPGGASMGQAANGVFIASEHCGLGEPEALWTDSTALGHLLAHELGHYLGLYHSLEESGLTDPIDDSDPQGNLMHWDHESEGGVELSAGQIQVLRSHHQIQW